MNEVPTLDFTSMGVRTSGPRKAIYKWLMEHPIHPTVDEIFRALRPEMPNLSRTTVYNVLYLLVEKGLVQQLDSEQGEARFDGTMTPHAHFKCTQCGAFVDFPEALPPQPEQSEGFRIDRTIVMHYGLCPACAAARAE